MANGQNILFLKFCCGSCIQYSNFLAQFKILQIQSLQTLSFQTNLPG